MAALAETETPPPSTLLWQKRKSLRLISDASILKISLLPSFFMKKQKEKNQTAKYKNALHITYY